MIDTQRLEGIFEDIFGDSIRDSVSMRLGHPVTGEVEIRIEDIGLPGMYWVHSVSGENFAPTGEESESDDDKVSATAAMLKPNKIPPGMRVYGAPVLVSLSKGVYQIEDLDGYAAVEFFHEFKERDQRSTDISQLDILLTRPTKPPSLSVEVTGGRVVLENVAYDFPTMVVDLTEHQDLLAPGEAVALMIEVDPTVPEIVVTPGDPFDDMPHEDAFDTYYPQDIDPARFLSSWVKLLLETTTIGITDIYHAQEIFAKGGGGGTPVIYCHEPLYYLGEVVTY